MTLSPEVVDFEEDTFLIESDQIEGRGLFPYQEDGARFLLGGNRMLGFPPGRGKTPTSIVAADALGAKRILVIAPLILLPKWKKEILQWSSRELPISVYRDTAFRPPSTGWVVSNPDLVVRRIDKFLIDVWDLIILDESILIKNRNSKRSKALKTLRRRTKRAWCLSGYPISRAMDDLWSQFQFLEPQSFTSYWRFAETYCVVENTVWGRNVVQSRSGINPVLEFRDVYRTVPPDVIDLPEPVVEVLDVELTPLQYKVYQKAQTEFLLSLRSGDVPIRSRLAQMSYLQQILGNLSRLEFTSESGKLIALTQMNDLGYLRPPILIWAQFHESIKGIVDVIERRTVLSVTSITGETSIEDRERILTDFRTGGVDVLVMQIKTGKFGLDLVETNTVVYYELSFSFDDVAQSMHRVYRLKLDHEVTTFVLSCPGSVDEVVLTNLVGKSVDVARLSQSELTDLMTQISLNLEKV